MTRNWQKTRKSHANKHQNYVIATSTTDHEQAREYEALLKNSDVPTLMLEENRGFSILVPEENIDEAHVIIESQDAYEDFYDYAVGDEDQDNNFDDELFTDDLE